MKCKNKMCWSCPTKPRMGGLCKWCRMHKNDMRVYSRGHKLALNDYSTYFDTSNGNWPWVGNGNPVKSLYHRRRR